MSNSRNHPLTWILSYMNSCVLVLIAVPFLGLFGPFLRDSKSCKIESRTIILLEQNYIYE